jgi:alpha-mannosidase
LPAGDFDRVYLLAAAINRDQTATFRVGDRPTELTIQEWTGFVGQWDTRLWKTTEQLIPPRAGAPAGTPPRRRIDVYGEMTGIRPGFIKRGEIAWFSSQRHAADGSAEPYSYSYLFAHALEIPAGARSLVLPENEQIRILAITVAKEPFAVTPAQPLYDTLQR